MASKRAQYSVHFFCNECSQIHALGISIALSEGPSEKESLSALYGNRKIPPKIAKLVGNILSCPNTGKLTSQKNSDHVFIVPVVD